MARRIRKSLLLLLTALSWAPAQPLLTPDEAVSLALKNNFDIRVSRNDAAVAKTNNTLGNAGMLPLVSANGSDNYSSTQHSDINALGAGVALTWTLFDGGKMFVTKGRLSEIESLGEIQYRDKIQQTVTAVISAYYDVVRQKQQLAAVEEVIAYNRERVRLLETGVVAGLSSRANLLQAKIDLNVFLENQISQQILVSTARRALNQVLARDEGTSFEVTDTILLSGVPDRDRLVRRLNDSNTTLLSLQRQVEIARHTLSEFKSLRWPKLSLSAGYEISKTDGGATTVSNDLLKGPRLNGTLSLPLFQAGNTQRQIETARLQKESAELALESARLQIAAQLRNALEQYDGQTRILAIERENAALAKENLDIAMNRLRLGQSTSLELKLAEDSYMESRTRLVNFSYNLKLTETKLCQLTADLP